MPAVQEPSGGMTDIEWASGRTNEVEEPGGEVPDFEEPWRSHCRRPDAGGPRGCDQGVENPDVWEVCRLQTSIPPGSPRNASGPRMDKTFPTQEVGGSSLVPC